MTTITVYQNDVGVEFVVETGQDLALATVTELHVKFPDGTTAQWTATISGTTLHYVTAMADLVQAGDYILQPYVEWGGGSKHHGNPITVRVKPAIC